jgi:hypothetical protein
VNAAAFRSRFCRSMPIQLTQIGLARRAPEQPSDGVNQRDLSLASNKAILGAP